MVTANVSGIIVNENNAPEAGPRVQAGGQTVATNQRGTFQSRNISLSQANARIKSEQAGYFTGCGGVF